MSRRFVLLVALIVIGALTYFVGTKLSSDAVGMALGMVFGALAGIPAALFALSATRRSEPDPDDLPYSERAARARQLPAYPYQPPVIVIQAPTYHPGQAEIERAMEPYRRADERLEAEAQLRGWGVRDERY